MRYGLFSYNEVLDASETIHLLQWYYYGDRFRLWVWVCPAVSPPTGWLYETSSARGSQGGGWWVRCSPRHYIADLYDWSTPYPLIWFWTHTGISRHTNMFCLLVLFLTLSIYITRCLQDQHARVLHVMNGAYAQPIRCGSPRLGWSFGLPLASITSEFG